MRKLAPSTRWARAGGRLTDVEANDLVIILECAFALAVIIVIVVIQRLANEVLRRLVLCVQLGKPTRSNSPGSVDDVNPQHWRGILRHICQRPVPDQAGFLPFRHLQLGQSKLDLQVVSRILQTIRQRASQSTPRDVHASSTGESGPAVCRNSFSRNNEPLNMTVSYDIGTSLITGAALVSNPPLAAGLRKNSQD
jgi:hypothetical protein